MDWLTLGMWWHLVKRALNYVPAQKGVLEIGFGPGKLHAELARCWSWCAGLDKAARMCSYAQHRVQRRGLVTRLAQGSLFALAHHTDAFDVVVSTFAFVRFPRGADAMREMVRVAIGCPLTTIPPGLFGLTCENRWEIFYTISVS